MKYTIHDVAQKANVSVATVSRVLNNNGYVHEDTKQLVQATIKALNYTPNQFARSLSNKHSKIIGIIVPHIGTPFYGELLEGIENAAMNKGYKVMLCNTKDDKNRELEYINIFAQYNVDGLIISSNFHNIKKVQELNIPIVTVDHILDETIPSITANNIEGGKIAAQKLIQNNRKNLVHLRGPSFLLTVNERTLGFLSEINKHEDIIHETFDFDLLIPDTKFILEHLKNNPQIDGIFASSDILAITAIALLQKLGRKIPEEVEVLGFDNISYGVLTFPNLTTIAQPVGYMGAQAFNTLIKLLKNEPIPIVHQIVDIELIERGSTINHLVSKK